MRGLHSTNSGIPYNLSHAEWSEDTQKLFDMRAFLKLEFWKQHFTRECLGCCIHIAWSQLHGQVKGKVGASQVRWHGCTTTKFASF